MAQPIPVPEDQPRQPKPLIPPEWGMTEDNIIWRQQPLTAQDIDNAAQLFGDYNPIHMSAESAKKMFGDEAPDRVAHGNLVLGFLSGTIASRYEGFLVHEIERIKIQNCFCIGDNVGFLVKEVESSTRLGMDIIKLHVYLIRKRPNGKDSILKLIPKHVPLAIQLQRQAKAN